MREWAGKRYWLVGASEGLGRALAERMSRAGVELVLSARNADRLQDLADSLPGTAHVVPVDASDLASVKAAAAAAVAAAGELDGVVYLAGVYWPFSAREWDAEKAEAMCDINFTGAARVVGAVMPGFMQRGRGHIVLTGSLSGFRGLPGSIGYGSSKAGVMHLAESMQCDLRGSDIQVQVANPGFIKTRLTEKNQFSMPFLMQPDDAAREMFEHMGTPYFKRSFPMVFSWLFRLSQFFPDWLYYRIFGGGK
ncbi:SDR family NAD(P)-dependent oxidoreductase [Roseicitreum antarcticum]|uniref:NADP-dependent 3-hydroxy acid dehydrogenase YdfG n=1 Tax=Roseicitreum antarcticum TaxID=564137 RepID=A0A1H3AM90_9RHOB|nr:SDR family NAD(P)-dependent oxidoreductase [Roseicitreum antarcticum]SDX30498.1 NADP-dependent 3-hydroxy acid dehydrogenase YdfG [Roseicitreum antarcticum]